MDYYDYNYDYGYHTPHFSMARYFVLIIIGSLSAIFNILLMLLILVHRHRFWTSYRNYLLSMLISSCSFAIVGFSVEANTMEGQPTDRKTMDSSLCKAWYVFCASVLDGSLLSLFLIHIDRIMSILSPHNYTTKAYERGSKLALSLMWVTVIITNLSFALSFNDQDEFHPSRPCLHLMRHRDGNLSVVWGSLHFISAVSLIIAIAYKTKAFPVNKIENKATSCVLPILLLDFTIAFMGFAPKIAMLVPPLKRYNNEEINGYLFLVDWSTHMLPPLFWLLDSNIRQSIGSICCCRCCTAICRYCTKQSKSVDLVEASAKQGSDVISGGAEM